MSTTHQELASLAAAYVIGALDTDEHEAFALHLVGCEACASEVRQLDRVADGLARAVPQVAPRPELRDRLMGAVALLDSQLPTFNYQLQGSNAWALGSLGVGSFRSWLPSAALAVLAIGVAVYATRSRADDDNAFESQAAMRVLAAPDLARIDLAGQPAAPAASARALWSRQRGMVFAAQNLPALPEGRTYQVWVVTAEAPISAGLLAPDASGRSLAVFLTPPDIGAPVAVAVTIEPAGGTPMPTGARYLIGTPAN